MHSYDLILTLTGGPGAALDLEVSRVERRTDPRHCAVVIGFGPTAGLGCGCCATTASPVLAGVSYLRDIETLREAGADSVYSGEGEVALAFIEDILDGLGATPEQIDRARARAHDELSSPKGRIS